MKASWIICALVLNLSLEQVKATQITRHTNMGNLVQVDDESTSDSDSSSSTFAQLEDEEPQESNEFFSNHATVQLDAEEQ